MKNRKKINKFILIFRIISLIIILVCIYFLIDWNNDNISNNQLQEELSEVVILNEDTSITINQLLPENAQIPNTSEDLAIKQFDINFQELKSQNSNTVAWVNIEDTNISYPIVQTSENVYYLTHNFQNKTNGAGWIFADFQNNFETLDKNTIIYGHNRRNGTMFSNLNYYLDKKFCQNESHKYFNFYTINKKYIAEIFSVYKISANNVELPISFENEEVFMQTINTWKAKSVYDFNSQISYEDNILTLYTCDNNTSYRILLHAKLIPLN